jgi:hypothetical protein
VCVSVPSRRESQPHLESYEASHRLRDKQRRHAIIVILAHITASKDLFLTGTYVELEVVERSQSYRKVRESNLRVQGGQKKKVRKKRGGQRNPLYQVRHTAAWNKTVGRPADLACALAMLRCVVALHRKDFPGATSQSPLVLPCHRNSRE